LLTILAGLLSSFAYATSDLFSQAVTRRVGPTLVVAWVLGVGTIVVLPVALLVDGVPHGGAAWRSVGLAALAGLAYVAAFSCLLRALRDGDLGLVSALNALQAAYSTIVFIALGAPATPLLIAALVLAAFGGVLASVHDRASTTAGAGWSFVSGALFAVVVVLYGYSHDVSWLTQAAVSRTVSLLVALPVALLAGGVSLPPGLRLSATGAGVLELGGLVMLTAALARGPLTVASITTAQFATFAVILGLVVLKERPKRHQLVGIACLVAAVSVLAAVT
jgi:drug/metabolite transporter (DMT)-like permease